MDSILILGAGLMQKPAILAAKELGLKVYVVDADEKAVSINLADCFSKIDLKAKEEIYEYAKTIPNLKSVFTAGTDFSASVSFVAEKLALPSHSFQAAKNASNKILMRECFSKESVPSPKFMSVTETVFNRTDFFNDEFIYDSASSQKLFYPIVVKPCDNMGGRGCRIARSKEECVSAVKSAIKNSRTQTAIAEEYMDGPEFSIDALVFNGSFTVTGFAERHIKYPPYFIEVGHTMSAQIDKKMRDELISVFALGAKSLGLTCGAAKADIKYTKNGAMIGEIAGRLSGGYMSGWTFPYASNLNLTKEAILIALGKSPEALLEKRIPVDFAPSENCSKKIKPYEIFEFPAETFSAERAWISIPGIIENIYLPNQNDINLCSKNVKDILPRATVSVGEKIDFPRNNVQKCGNIITHAKTYDDAVSEAEKTISKIFIKLKSNEKSTDNFLKGITESDEQNFPPSAFNIEKSDLEKILADKKNVPANEKFSNHIPEVLKKSDYVLQKDWNYLTIAQTVNRIDELYKTHKEISTGDFFSALLRGGIQGADYVLRSIT